MSYRENYEKWLHSPALSAAEKAELESIQGDEKEIESRFFDQLSFGTAGLRGTMGVGLYRMNVHVIRHATQAFAQVILEEGKEAAAQQEPRETHRVRMASTRKPPTGSEIPKAPTPSGRTRMP